jgi:hypothetical protein
MNRGSNPPQVDLLCFGKKVNEWDHPYRDRRNYPEADRPSSVFSFIIPVVVYRK